MKINTILKTSLFLTILLLSSFGFSQELSQEPTTSKLKSIEIKLNVAYLLIDYAEVSYERILDEESSLGISAGFLYSNRFWGGNNNAFMAVPYYRFFFGKTKNASGFFLEGNGAILYTRTSDIFGASSSFGFGLGFAIGAKFATKKGWVAEVFSGLGRNFLDAFYPRLGISVGKRF